jgi:predicted TIM-barrel fold metal-dependent hydrolase
VVLLRRSCGAEGLSDITTRWNEISGLLSHPSELLCGGSVPAEPTPTPAHRLGLPVQVRMRVPSSIGCEGDDGHEEFTTELLKGSCSRWCDLLCQITSITALVSAFGHRRWRWSIWGSVGAPASTKGRRRILRVLVALFAFSQIAAAQALIDYHQHLLMPTEKSQGFLASDLVKLLDDAHISRALVLSMAYRYGNPNQPPVANEYAHVKAENDWVSEQVAQYPNRLRGLCGVDPLKSYALAEIARCAQDPNLHCGLKMHFGNSDVDLDNPEHVEDLGKVFQAASAHHMAIVVHMHPSVTRHRPYGAKEAQIFLTQVLPAAAGAYVQIAHFAGSGGYDDPDTDEALCVFIRAIQRHDPNMKTVYFDITNVAGLGNWEPKRDLIAKRTREIGVHRVLFGSDGYFGGGVTPVRAWADFRSLPLSKVEFRIIASNVTLYIH